MFYELTTIVILKAAWSIEFSKYTTGLTAKYL